MSHNDPNTETFDIKFQLEKDQDQIYKLSITIPNVDVLVEEIDVDLRRGLASLATKCVDRLNEKGYIVDPEYVLLAIMEALKSKYPNVKDAPN